MVVVSDVPPPPESVPPPPPDVPTPGSSTPPPPPPPPSSLDAPAGYVGYDAGPTVSGVVKRVGGISKAVMILPGLVAAATVVQAFVSSAVTDDARSFLAGDISDDEFRDAIVAVGAVGSFTTMLTLAALIVTVIWMFRIASNVRAFGRRTTWSPLFSIFGWVLPPFLYIIPFLVLRELWKASEPSHVDGTERWKQERVSPLLWVWLVAFGLLPAALFLVEVSSLATTSFGSGALDSQAETLEDFGIVQWFSAALSVIAAAVWIPFVRHLTGRHRQLTNEA